MVRFDKRSALVRVTMLHLNNEYFIVAVVVVKCGKEFIQTNIIHGVMNTDFKLYHFS